MKLTDIIVERKRPLKSSSYRYSVEEEKAWKMILKHCKDSIPHMDTPIVRGMRGNSAENIFMIINGAAGERKSRNTKNFYTVILDHVLTPLGFPKRSASIICGNWKNRSHANGYGTLYAIIPFDGVKIGVCPGEDMFDTEIKLGNKTHNISRWNEEFDKLDISDDDTYSDMVGMLEMKAETAEDEGWEDSDQYWLKAFLDQNGDKVIKEAYTKPFTLTTTKESAYDDGAEHELWIGGKCIAIEFYTFKRMLKNQPTET